MPIIMPYTKKNLPDSQIEITVTVPPKEYRPALDKAAERISNRVSIRGFRKGKAPFDLVRQEVGDMAILNEALEDIVKETFYHAVMEEKLETIGMPDIQVEKLAPDNDVVYVATVALMPRVVLPDLKKITLAREEPKIDDTRIEETIAAVRGMHAVETIKDGLAEGTDKLVLDLDMSIDNVPVEGGQAKKYQVYLGEDHYIPGFNEQVRGLKKDDTKTFSLDFPKTHYQKHLAGKTVDFAVSVHDVYTRDIPELNDELAKKLGQESAEKLRELVHNNLYEEATQKTNQKNEIALLQRVIEKTTFDPIPEVLVNAERQKMFYELKRDLEKNSIAIDQYLADMKKTEKELYEDFRKQAEERAKAALVSRQVAEEHHLFVSDTERDAEIQTLKDAYQHNKEAQENLDRREVQGAIATQLQNRKVMQFLKAAVFGEDMVADPTLRGCADCETDHAHDHNHQHNK